ncbi:glutathione S-transferase family protein [Paracoccus aminophilus]|uniref:Glutathione S-transferase n=1 Tax=Paracoccus aminophilus JCM 7686 TaxID=1367847 RepID=S5XVF1_PARAH|nr:glutathione S-transferase family protein [Paracoccus aminophilus]AGT07350.1 glutathione S-transferase [Paracoccus aminophilus JCM 7686]
MLTFYHAPQSRSSSVLVLLKELGIDTEVEIRKVDVPRQDGSGRRDPSNPHPEGKVPYLTNGEDHVRERGAIMLYLTDMFPAARLGPLPGQPKRGQYLGWLAWYQGVLEPVMVFNVCEIIHPALAATFRDYDTAVQRLDEVLRSQPYLLGDSFSAADLLIASPFIFFGEAMPKTPAIADWVARIQSRPAMLWARDFDA